MPGFSEKRGEARGSRRRLMPALLIALVFVPASGFTSDSIMVSKVLLQRSSRPVRQRASASAATAAVERVFSKARGRGGQRRATTEAIEGTEVTEEMGSGSGSSTGQRKNSVQQAFDKLTSAFPLWVSSAAVLGVLRPATMTWFTGEYVTAALSITMICMGMTMKFSDFKRVLVNPRPVILGTMLQYTVMPLAAFSMARLFSLSPALSAGVILVGCCPGGTASNLVTLIAQGDVALSVLMTSASTVAASIMTPLLTQGLLRGAAFGSVASGGTAAVSVSGRALFSSTAKLVLAPVLAGLVLNRFAKDFTSKIAPYTPLLCVVLVALICGSIVASNAAVLLTSGIPIVGALVATHVLGFSAGYGLSRALGMADKSARTISIEVGMQNSALATVLASRAFSNPLTCIPGAVSATLHSLIGSSLAAFWRWRDARKPDRGAAGA